MVELVVLLVELLVQVELLSTAMEGLLTESLGVLLEALWTESLVVLTEELVVTVVRFLGLNWHRLGLLLMLLTFLPRVGEASRRGNAASTAARSVGGF